MNTAKYFQRSDIHPVEPAVSLTGNEHIAVIPVYDENDSIAATLLSIKKALRRSPEPVITVLVINEPVDAPPAARANNRQLLESLRKNDGKFDGTLTVGKELFFIDLIDKEIPNKFRNVGNARKAGFDGTIFANDGNLTDKDPLFFSLDADTLIAEDYFEKAILWAKENPTAAGAVFHFEHRFENSDAAVNNAAMCYEIYLRDYAWKLKETTTPYAFWTIGSAFMCCMSGYVTCGGMRRNAAGEDFYFLQALCKVGPVGVVQDTTVYPSGRVSNRVPFGTGPAIQQAVEGKAVKLYNQKCFDELKEFFTAAASAEYNSLKDNIQELMGQYVKEFLQTQDFSSVWAKSVKNTPKNQQRLLKALHTYCDGFFILKFCHYLEEKYPQIFFRQELVIPGDIAEYLKNLRELDRRRFC